MKLYESECKKLFRQKGIPVPHQYGTVSSWAEFLALNVEYPVMLKSNVLVGGRGLAGGIKKVNNAAEAKENLEKLLKLVIKGHAVENLLVESAAPTILGSCYIGATMDPRTFRTVMMVSAAGGVEIEVVAKEAPEKIFRYSCAENEKAIPDAVAVDLAKKLADGLQMDAEIIPALKEIIQQLYLVYYQCDAKVLEINPLLITSKSTVMAVDGKLVLDDNALYRHQDLLNTLCGQAVVKRHETSEPTANEQRAANAGFNYVDLLSPDSKKEDGKLYVGLVPGGAGYGIFSIDEVANVGDRFFDGCVVPVNFMDSGGGPAQKTVAEMFHLLMDYQLVDLVITSRFGGVSSCDIFIKGLVQALRERFKAGQRMIPVYGRMVGTDLPAARAYLDAAKKETPDALKDMHVVVGNQRIMVEVIKEGVAYALKREPKGGNTPAAPTPSPAVLEKLDITSVPQSGMCFNIVKERRPELAARIAQKMKNDPNYALETIVVGLGNQGTRHAQLMRDYGTNIAAAIAPGYASPKVHETIPVYDTVKDCLEDHPDIIAASVWKHYSTAKDAVMEVINSGIPIVVLITEFIPVNDVRDILIAAKKHNTLLFGGNTPGVIFPPERVKIGMLPNVFHPEETKPGVFGTKGVTIISRSGAILYHLSDALASVGVAQNAVLGIGGDSANGSTFSDLVPLAMSYEGTDLVVVAGEIGGMKEELLAEDILANKAKYPKPIVALISGAHAPEGKTMGHAGAIVAPGQAYGTFQNKKAQLEKAGVVVVNCQLDLIKAVQEKLNNKKYFEPDRYYARMKQIWESPPPKPSWSTCITSVKPNSLVIHGYRLKDIIAKQMDMMSVTYLLLKGELPVEADVAAMDARALEGAAIKIVGNMGRIGNEDLSKVFGRLLLSDATLAEIQETRTRMFQPLLAAYTLGRCVRYLAHIYHNEKSLEVGVSNKESWPALLFRAVSGESSPAMIKMQDQTDPRAARAKLIQTMVVACCDHGVTPPSAQGTLLAATVRASYEVAVAQGVMCITDVHGGAGAKAADFFKLVVAKSKAENIPLRDACVKLMRENIASGKRVEGLGHRVHTNDPRRDVMWSIAEAAGVNGDCIAVSKLATECFKDAKGIDLPINVDGVLGAIVCDLGLDTSFAKVFFIVGRVAGLSAHYYEEVSSQANMRRIVYEQAAYRGKAERELPQ